MRLWGHVCSALVVVGGAGILSSACAHDDSTIFVYDVLAGTASTTGCSFTPDPTQAFLSSGVLDAALRGAYDATFLLANQMVPQGDPTVPTTETSFITIQRADVKITDANNNQLGAFSTKTSATLNPATGNTPGFVPVAITLIDEGTVQSLIKNTPLTVGGVDRVETIVKFFGKTTGGVSVESNEFTFPVDVCYSQVGAPCLVTFPAGVSDLTRTPSLNCVLGAQGTATTTSSVATPCRVGQDAPVACSLCLSNPICNPPTVPLLDAGAG